MPFIDAPSITSLVDAVNAAAASFKKNGDFSSVEERQSLIEAAEKLAIAARDDSEMVFLLGTNVSLLSIYMVEELPRCRS